MDTLSGGDISNIRFSVLKSLGFRSIYLYFAKTSIIDVAPLLRRVRSSHPQQSEPSPPARRRLKNTHVRIMNRDEEAPKIRAGEEMEPALSRPAEYGISRAAGRRWRV